MGGVDILTSSPDKENTSAFNSLIQAMQETGKVMICRFLPRNNQTPHLVVLSPRKFLLW